MGEAISLCLQSATGVLVIEAAHPTLFAGSDTEYTIVEGVVSMQVLMRK
jgi:hypothetical protein